MDERTPIRSKLVPPRLRGATIVRPRVERLLEDAATSAVTLVSAPPGYGKRIAVASWLARRGGAAAWVTLDTHDEDPVRLWTYVCAAVRQALRGVAAEAPSETTAEPAIEALATELAADGRPLVIVLDALDHVRSKRSLATIEHAVRALPAHVRLVLIARADPALPLARWRGSGELSELRAGQLAFTREEARELLRAAEGVELSAAELDTLVARTDGWPVALHLAALRLKTTGAPLGGFTGRSRDVAKYLATEVVAGLDDELQDFLHRSAILPRLSAALCDTVLERTDSAALLERVARENLFLDPLDEEGEWFRYQALFAEYLQAALSEDEAAALHRRAAGWFRAHGYVEDAVEHAAAGGDEQAIAELLEAHHLALARGGRTATVDRWIGALPRDLLAARPGVLTAGVLAAGGCAHPREQVRGLLALADRARGADPAAWTAYHETARLLLASLYGDDDVGAALASAREAVALAHGDATDLEVVSLAMLALALELDGDAEEADGVARAALEHPDSSSSPYGRVGALATRALSALALRRPHVAAELAGRALDEARHMGVSESLPGAVAQFALARAALADDRPVDAERALRRAFAVRDAVEGGALHAWLQITRAEVSVARGRLRMAERELALARELLAGCADPGGVAAHAHAAERRIEELRAGAAAPVEPLSKSEIAVLRLFEGDRSAREIGAELYLSLNTVKTHIRAIYRKLGVGTREDALARAESLGVLD